MATQKEIKSAINVLNARLDQVKTSHHFSKSERELLIKRIQPRLEELTQQLDVKDAEIL